MKNSRFLVYFRQFTLGLDSKPAHLAFREKEVRMHDEVQIAALTHYCAVRLAMSFYRGVLAGSVGNPEPIQKTVNLLFTGEGMLTHCGVDQRIIPWVPTSRQMSLLLPDGQAGRFSVTFGAIAERALDWTCERLSVTVPEEEFDRIVAEIEEDVRRRMEFAAVVTSSRSDRLLHSFFGAFQRLGGSDGDGRKRLLAFARSNPRAVIRALWLAYDDISRQAGVEVTPPDRAVGYETGARLSLDTEVRRRFRAACTHTEAIREVAT